MNYKRTIFYSLLALSLNTPVFAADLTLEIMPTCSDEGKILLSVFDEKNAFQNQHDIKAVANLELRASTVKQKITLHDLKKGKYAVSVLHDQNDNQLLDMKGIIPKEGYAFSNGVGKKSSPDFQEAVISLRNEDISVPLRFIYHSANKC